MSRKSVIAVVGIVLALPPAFALIEAAAFHARNRNNASIESGGESRPYIIFVPRSYDASRPLPLVISLHGAAGWPAQQMHLSGWNRIAERERFIVVYPSGSDAIIPRIWRLEDSADVDYIAELIDHVEKSYNIDRRRIYANGFSNGGGMTFVLSCRLSDRIAAVGLVGAAQTLSWSWCNDRHPIPMISFHGNADPFAPYDGGKSPIAPDVVPFANVKTWAENWARRNQCDARGLTSSIAQNVVRTEYVHCANDADVTLYTVRGGGHQWFGGQPLPEWFVGPQDNSIDATEIMWAFFRAHPLHS